MCLVRGFPRTPIGQKGNTKKSPSSTRSPQTRNARTFEACAGSSIRRLSEWPRLLPRCASVRHRRVARHFSSLTASRAWSRRFVKCWGVGGVGNTFKYFSQMPKLFSSAGCTARAVLWGKWQRSRNNVRDPHRLPDASMRGPAIRPEPRRLGEDGYPGRNAGARRVAPCMGFPQFWRTCPPFRYVVCARTCCLRVL